MQLFPLEIEGAEARRRGRRLLGPVDLRLEGGGTTVVLGPNGAGKTTFLQVLHGTTRLSAGRVTWQTATDAARAQQAFVFQRPIMLRRSVADNLAYPLLVRGTPRPDALRKAGDWAQTLGLAAHLGRSATRLSGGEQQKLALARALITAPAVLFLDEPTASLDGQATREIEALLAQAKDAGTTLILSTHDLGQARRLADEVVFLHKGDVVEHGPAPAFFDAPRAKQAQAFLQGDIVE